MTTQLYKHADGTPWNGIGGLRGASGATYFNPQEISARSPGTYSLMLQDGITEYTAPDPALPEPTEAEIVEESISRIDGFCDQVYTGNASRATRYEQKYQESLRYVANGYPGTVSANDYPYLVYEAPQRGMTKRDLADLIIAKAEAFNQFGAKAEAARAELPGAVAGGADSTDKQNAAAAIVAAINTLAQALLEA